MKGSPQLDRAVSIAHALPRSASDRAAAAIEAIVVAALGQHRAERFLQVAAFKGGENATVTAKALDMVVDAVLESLLGELAKTDKRVARSKQKTGR